MNDTAIVALIKEGRDVEDGVEHCDKGFATAHQADKAFGVVEDGPGVVPCIAFGEGVAPLEGIEGGLELAVFHPAAHEAGFRVEDVLVVHGMLAERLQLGLRLAEFLAELVDTPVVIGIFKSAGHGLVDLDVVWDIAEAVVVIETEATGGGDTGVHGVGAVGDGLPEGFDVIRGGGPGGNTAGHTGGRTGGQNTGGG